MSEYCSNCASVAERYEDQVDRLDKRIRTLAAELESYKKTYNYRIDQARGVKESRLEMRIRALERGLRDIRSFLPIFDADILRSGEGTKLLDQIDVLLTPVETAAQGRAE